MFNSIQSFSSSLVSLFSMDQDYFGLIGQIAYKTDRRDVEGVYDILLQMCGKEGNLGLSQGSEGVEICLYFATERERRRALEAYASQCKTHGVAWNFSNPFNNEYPLKFNFAQTVSLLGLDPDSPVELNYAKEFLTALQTHVTGSDNERTRILELSKRFDDIALKVKENDLEGTFNALGRLCGTFGYIQVYPSKEGCCLEFVFASHKNLQAIVPHFAHGITADQVHFIGDSCSLRLSPAQSLELLGLSAAKKFDFHFGQRLLNNIKELTLDPLVSFPRELYSDPLSHGENLQLISKIAKMFFEFGTVRYMLPEIAFTIFAELSMQDFSTLSMVNTHLWHFFGDDRNEGWKVVNSLFKIHIVDGRLNPNTAKSVKKSLFVSDGKDCYIHVPRFSINYYSSFSRKCEDVVVKVHPHRADRGKFFFMRQIFERYVPETHCIEIGVYQLATLFYWENGVSKYMELDMSKQISDENNVVDQAHADEVYVYEGVKGKRRMVKVVVPEEQETGESDFFSILV